MQNSSCEMKLKINKFQGLYLSWGWRRAIYTQQMKLYTTENKWGGVSVLRLIGMVMDRLPQPIQDDPSDAGNIKWVAV